MFQACRGARLWVNFCEHDVRWYGPRTLIFVPAAVGAFAGCAVRSSRCLPASARKHEEAVVDTRSGAFVNRDLAEYLVPVHADIPEIDAVVLDGFDDKANVLGVKGLGELGICGAGAGVANAVFNATGVRVRNFPITLDKVLPGLPLVDD